MRKMNHDDRLPFEYPFKKAISIYLKRIGGGLLILLFTFTIISCIYLFKQNLVLLITILATALLISIAIYFIRPKYSKGKVVYSEQSKSKPIKNRQKSKTIVFLIFFQIGILAFSINSLISKSEQNIGLKWEDISGFEKSKSPDFLKFEIDPSRIEIRDKINEKMLRIEDIDKTIQLWEKRILFLKEEKEKISALEIHHSRFINENGYDSTFENSNNQEEAYVGDAVFEFTKINEKDIERSNKKIQQLKSYKLSLQSELDILEHQLKEISLPALEFHIPEKTTD